MQKVIFLSLLFLITGSSFAQNSNQFYAHRPATMSFFSMEDCNTGSVADIRLFLQKKLNCELSFHHTASHQLSRTYTFTQVKNGIAIYHAFAKVILENNTNTFLVIHDLFYDLPETTTQKAHSCWFYYQNSWVLTTQTEKFSPTEGTVNEILTDPNNTIISITDLALRSQAKDSSIRIKVFNPDPLTSAHKVYAAPYLDYNDSDVAVINAERQWKKVSCTFKNDTFWLSNKYLIPFKFNLNTSYDPVFRVLDTVFDYTRHQHEFEDLMVLYHITNFQEYINNIGYSTLGLKPTPYDAHGDKTDNSMYLPGWGLIYGTGGIDDAEDAETIVHEYSHSLREYASPSTNNGLERQATEEGFMDYFATSYKMSIDSFGWKKFGYWDGNNPPYYSGRSVASTKIYPQALTGNIYENCEIWSSALMRIYLKLGKTVTDKITIQTFYYLTNNLTMSQTAMLVIKADSTLFGGVHTETIWRTFAETHILPWYTGIPSTASKLNEKIKLINSINFMTGGGSLEVYLPLEEKGSYDITNSLMQTIKTETFHGRHFRIEQGSISSAGVYYLTITTSHYIATQKIIIQ